MALTETSAVIVTYQVSHLPTLKICQGRLSAATTANLCIFLLLLVYNRKQYKLDIMVCMLTWLHAFSKVDLSQ